MRTVATVAAVADFMRRMKRQNRDESQWISAPANRPNVVAQSKASA
jgi:hypothetical protein